MEAKNELAPYFFHQGTSARAYDYLGFHLEEDQAVFRVWAPNAERVLVVGDFNAWQDTHPMHRVTEGGVWEISLPKKEVSLGTCYKYKIVSHGKEFLKADPYAFSAERPPATAGIVCALDGYCWRDDGWLQYRASKAGRMYCEPMNVYELHLGSWKRHSDGTYYSYGELARELAPYVKQMGYTHIELLPVMEHPFDGSWGYQVCSYYAPSARFGTPQEFMAFVDSMHEAGIGVILDWVPAHFPKDGHGLYEFDGMPLYEYGAPDQIENRTWGTRRFDVGRNEVQSFLVSNADFWFRQYHIDGLRVDAVSSMLYLDYDKQPGEWTPNIYGDHRCLEAIAFFQKLNSYIKQAFPDVLMIAEESTAWPNVTSFDWDGLGFDLKWNMGWMNDTLFYASLDPVYRKYHHEKLTFSLTYAFREHFLLPLSHDEVVHGKGSLLGKMSGDDWQKLASVRAFLGYMMVHPGKKLLFMGAEIGGWQEWNSSEELPWYLLNYERHARLQYYVAALNHFYLRTPALWEVDDSWEGYRWINADCRNESILSLRRIDRSGEEVIALLNFTPVAREDFLVGVPNAGIYEEIFNSDRIEFGGSGVLNLGELPTAQVPMNSFSISLKLRIPPLGIVILQQKK